MLETQLFEKEGSLSGEKKFLPYFSHSIKNAECQGTFYEGPECFLTITVGVIGSIL